MISLLDAIDVSRRDALGRVIEQAVANAAAGLSEMVGRSIDMRALEVSIMNVDQVPRLLSGPEDIAVGIYLAVGGDVNGHILLLLSPPDAKHLVDMLMDVPDGTTVFLGAMERSALGEVGNLTGSFFLNALAEITSLGAQPSPPAVMVDMGTAILDIPLVALAESSDDVLLISTAFAENERHVDAAFLVMPDVRSLRAILDSLGKKSG